MQETMFIIEFMNGKQKRFDDDRFRYEIDYDGNSMQVFSRISKNLVLDVPTLTNVAFIHVNVIKKQRKSALTNKGFSDPVPTDNSEEMSVEEAMLIAQEEISADNFC